MTDKPCLARIPSTLPRGAVRWCLREDGHTGEHEGVTERELEGNDLGPKWKPGWAR